MENITTNITKILFGENNEALDLSFMKALINNEVTRPEHIEKVKRIKEIIEKTK